MLPLLWRERHGYERSQCIVGSQATSISGLVEKSQKGQRPHPGHVVIEQNKPFAATDTCRSVHRGLWGNFVSPDARTNAALPNRSANVVGIDQADAFDPRQRYGPALIGLL